MLSKRRCAAALLAVSIALAPVEARPREVAPRDANPFVGHNTYGQHEGCDRLASALASGIPGLELDVSWGRLRRSAVVTHNRLTSGFGHPELGAYASPIWPAWQGGAGGQGGRDEGGQSGDGPRVLMFDLKSGEEGMARRLHEVLAPHADQLSRMQPGGVFRQGRITVYVSGRDDAQAAYERHARSRGEYLAFGACSHERDDWRPDAAAYAPAEPPGWRRYVNIDIRCFMKRQQDGDADFSQLAPSRLAAAVAACGTAGYPIRVWTVNARRDGAFDPAPWRSCVDAGIAMIATDDHVDAMKFWTDLRR